MFRSGQYESRQPGDPAVIFLDFKLPLLNGLQVLEELKRDSSTRTVPVVMLTASREETDMVRSYSLVVNAYVVKPIDFNSFQEAIREMGMFWGALNEIPSRR